MYNHRYLRHVSRLVAVLLAIFLLAGCGSTNTPAQTTAAVQNTGAAGSTEPTVAMKGNMYLAGVPIVKDKETISMLITYSGGKAHPKDMGIHKILEEKTNIAINFDYILSEASKERKATMFASGDYTDTIGGDILSDADVITYGTQGAIIPLEGLIKEYMPRFQKILDENPFVKKVITAPDGHIYTLPVINYRSCWPDAEHYAVPTWNINKKWLATLGMSIPKNTDELLEVLRAFKTKDPNGNGKPDEIPMNVMYTTGNRTITTCLYPAFGIVDYMTSKTERHVDVIDGKVVNVATLPQYKDAIKYMRQLYAEGLVDPELFTQDTAKYTAKIKQSEPTIVGVFSAFGGYAEAGSDRILEEFDDILPLEGPGGQKLWGRQNAGVSRNKLAITSSCKNPEVVARWADELFDPEISVQVQYGILGKELELTSDGKYKQVDPPEGKGVEEWLREDTTRVIPHAVLDAESVIIGKDGQTKYNKSLKYKDFVDPEILPPAYMLAEENEEIVRVETSLNSLIDQKAAEWITGQSDIDAQWDSFQKQLKDLGVDRQYEIRQKILDRYNNN